MKLSSIVCALYVLLSLPVVGETKTVFMERPGSLGETNEYAIEVEDGQVLEILGFGGSRPTPFLNQCFAWEIDFGNGSIFRRSEDPILRVFAGPLKLKITFSCSDLLLTYRITQDTPLPRKTTPVLNKLSLEGPELTSEYSVAPGFVYRLSSSSDLIVWEKLSDHSSPDGKLTISQPVSEEPESAEFFRLE